MNIANGEDDNWGELSDIQNTHNPPRKYTQSKHIAVLFLCSLDVEMMMMIIQNCATKLNTLLENIQCLRKYTYSLRK